MIAAYIHKLNEREPGRSLETLEADIWARIEADARITRTASTVIAWQVGVIVFALVGGIVTGNLAASATRSGELDVFSPKTDLAPSELLLGSKN